MNFTPEATTISKTLGVWDWADLLDGLPDDFFDLTPQGQAQIWKQILPYVLDEFDIEFLITRLAEFVREFVTNNLMEGGKINVR